MRTWSDRVLDDALRQDVPGTWGWRNDPDKFVGLTIGDPEFDPATYLIAVHQVTGQYVGLVRVWRKPDVPRLGMVAVLPPWRRQGLASALIAQAFGVLYGRGLVEVSTEVDRPTPRTTP